jgi:hypothetical protein
VYGQVSGGPRIIPDEWYRRRIEVAGAGSALALLIPPVDDAYEVFWNGKLIGSYGAMPPRAKWFAFGHPAVYRLPDGDGAKGAADREPGGELAMRIWKRWLSAQVR